MSVSIATLTWPTSPHSTLALAEEMGGGEAVVLFFSPFISYSRRANHSVVTNRLASSETRQQFCSPSDSEQESVKTQPRGGSMWPFNL